MNKENLTNIEKFNELAALIFDKLYQNFPCPIGLSYKELTGFDRATECPRDEYDFVSATLDWLDYSGFIIKGNAG